MTERADTGTEGPDRRAVVVHTMADDADVGAWVEMQQDGEHMAAGAGRHMLGEGSTEQVDADSEADAVASWKSEEASTVAAVAVVQAAVEHS